MHNAETFRWFWQMFAFYTLTTHEFVDYKFTRFQFSPNKITKWTGTTLDFSPGYGDSSYTPVERSSKLLWKDN
jgi:hypothetical protein